MVVFPNDLDFQTTNQEVGSSNLATLTGGPIGTAAAWLLHLGEPVIAVLGALLRLLTGAALQVGEPRAGLGLAPAVIKLAVTGQGPVTLRQQLLHLLLGEGLILQHDGLGFGR